MIKWKLDQFMHDNYLTIEEVAIRTNVHRNIIARIRNNKQTRVDISVIERLCTGLNISPNDLFSIE